MGIFSRFRDIVSANLNAMLERAEDPEKLIKLMIQEMEDTLVELKASCAGAMANRARLSRALATSRERAEGWE
ncbi:MAG: PspA/IM30 family protein, partial [Opitutales bacterium]